MSSRRSSSESSGGFDELAAEREYLTLHPTNPARDDLTKGLAWSIFVIIVPIFATLIGLCLCLAMLRCCYEGWQRTRRAAKLYQGGTAPFSFYAWRNNYENLNVDQQQHTNSEVSIAQVAPPTVTYEVQPSTQMPPQQHHHPASMLSRHYSLRHYAAPQHNSSALPSPSHYNNTLPPLHQPRSLSVCYNPTNYGSVAQPPFLPPIPPPSPGPSLSPGPHRATAAAMCNGNVPFHYQHQRSVDSTVTQPLCRHSSYRHSRTHNTNRQQRTLHHANSQPLKWP